MTSILYCSAVSSAELFRTLTFTIDDRYITASHLKEQSNVRNQENNIKIRAGFVIFHEICAFCYSSLWTFAHWRTMFWFMYFWYIWCTFIFFRGKKIIQCGESSKNSTITPLRQICQGCSNRMMIFICILILNREMLERVIMLVMRVIMCLQTQCTHSDIYVVYKNIWVKRQESRKAFI